jgi:hypothetical protein
MNTNNFSPEMLDPALPGSEIVIQGLADIQRGAITPFSVILFVAAPRFRLLGIEIPPLSGLKDPNITPFEHQLYELLQTEGGYSRYNALLRRIVSFAAGIERKAKICQESE